MTSVLTRAPVPGAGALANPPARSSVSPPRPQLVTVGGCRGRDRRSPRSTARAHPAAARWRRAKPGPRRPARPPVSVHHHRPARRTRRRPDQHRVVGGHALEIRAPRDHGCARLRHGRPAARPGRAGRDPLESGAVQIPGSHRGDVSGFVEVAPADGDGGRRSGDQRDYEEGRELVFRLCNPGGIADRGRPSSATAAKRHELDRYFRHNQSARSAAGLVINLGSRMQRPSCWMIW